MPPTRATPFQDTSTNTAAIKASMRIRTVLLAGILTFALGARANMVVSSWTPIFKGIDRAVGTNFPPTTISSGGVTFTDNTLQVVNCVRVDLTDPDVQLFTTP